MMPVSRRQPPRARLPYTRLAVAAAAVAAAARLLSGLAPAAGLGLAGPMAAGLDAVLFAAVSAAAYLFVARGEPAVSDAGMTERWLAPSAAMAMITGTASFTAATFVTSGDPGAPPADAQQLMVAVILAAVFAAAAAWSLHVRRIGAMDACSSGRSRSRRVVLATALGIIVLFAAVQFSVSLVTVRLDRKIADYDRLIELTVRQQMLTERIARYARSLTGGTVSDAREARSLLIRDVEELRGEAIRLGEALAAADMDDLVDAETLQSAFGAVAARRVALLAEAELLLSGQASRKSDLDARAKLMFESTRETVRAVRALVGAHRDAALSWKSTWLLFGPSAIIGLGLFSLVPVAGLVGRQEAALVRRAVELEDQAFVLSHIPCAVVVWGADRRVTWVNDAFERIVGRRRDDVIGLPPEDAFPVEAAEPHLRDVFVEPIAEGGSLRVELPGTGTAGAAEWLDVVVEPRYDGAGRLIGHTAIARDVTADVVARRAIAGAHRRAEAALAELGAYRAGLDNHSIVSVTDRQGRITYVNDAFCAVSGYSRAELIGNTHALVASGVHDEAFYADFWRTISGGRIWKGEVCDRARDGSFYWLDTTVVPMRGPDGAIESFVAIRTDITARKAYEQSIVASERRLASVIEGTGVGTWEWNVETNETSINEKWAEIVGSTVAGLGPLTVDVWLDRIHPQDRPLVDQALARHFSGERDAYDVEVRLRHRDGHWVWVHDRGKVATRAPDGRPLLMAGTHQDISARKAAEEALRTAHGQMRSVIDCFPGGLMFVDRDLRLLGFNENYRTMLDLPDRLFEVGMPNLVDIFRFNAERGEYGPGEVETIVAERRRRALEGEPHVLERTRPDGRTLEIRGMPLPDGGFVTTYTDVTDRIRSRTLIEEKSRLAEQKSRELEITMDHMTEGLSVFDGDGRLVTWNRRFPALYGLPDAAVRVGMPFTDVAALHTDRRDGDADPASVVADIRAGRRSDVLMRLADGRVVAMVSSPTPDGGWVATHEDVTEREQAAERIAFAAHHDVLTGLANRAGLKATIGRLVDTAIADGQQFSVLLLDLDRFKAVNDTFGHAVGDKLLQQVADRMRANVRDQDVVARLGGDEFALYFAAAQDHTDASVVIATRLLAALSAPYTIDGCQVSVGASIGIAIAPEHGTDLDTLMRNADSALYEVKAAGRNAFRIFDDQLAREARDRRELEADLRDALQHDQLELFYQPIVSVTDRRIVGMEALLRWNHPRRGLVPPDLFIPIAEQTGQIASIGAWIIRTACRDAAAWPDDVRVAVNVSPAQLGQLDFVDTVTRALLQARLDPDRLELEVTETVLLGNDDAVLGDLHQLRSLGVRIALDDFGTGYSSLSYLRLFPFDKIKIDRSFVREIEDSPHCSAIVVAVAGLARSLGLTTTAEGVETEEQFALLAAAGCTTVQGYLFGQPRGIDGFDLHAPAPRAVRRA
jgi:diguanylate cyclase (GGDEF)-like protein/PAS domain S-box-containing protein